MSSKILVVDDSATIRQQVSEALHKAGFEVLEAVDGVDGSEKVASHPEIRLVVCDMNMPRMNGLEMLSTIKKDGGYKDLPIIMLTTEADPSFIARAKSLGAKAWVVKPFRSDPLIAVIRKLLNAAA